MTATAGKPEPVSPDLNKAENEGVYVISPKPERAGFDPNRAVADPPDERVNSSACISE